MISNINIGDQVLIRCMNKPDKYWAEGTIVSFFPNAAVVDLVSFDGRIKGCTGVPYTDLIKKERTYVCR